VPATTSARSLKLRPYQPGDEGAIQNLYRGVFDRERSLERWQWLFHRAPAGPATVMLLTDAEAVIGHIACVPFRGYVLGVAHDFALGVDTMVHSDRRSPASARALFKGYRAITSGVTIGFPTDRTARLLQRHCDTPHLGRLTQWVRWCSVEALERSLGRPIAAVLRPQVGVALAAIGALARHQPSSLRVAPLRDVDGDIDRLADESAGFAPCIRRRDAAYVTWRWLEQPGSRWKLLGAWDRGGRLQGWVVFGLDHHADKAAFRVGRIVDILARHPTATRRLIVIASDRLAEQGAGLVTIECNDPRRRMRGALYRGGFLPRGQGMGVSCRAKLEPASSIPECLANWYLTRGDTDLG